MEQVRDRTSEEEIYIIPSEVMVGIRSRLFGNSVKVKTLKTIAEEYGICFKDSLIVKYTSGDEDKDKHRLSNTRCYGNKECKNVVELGYVIIDSIGHYSPPKKVNTL